MQINALSRPARGVQNESLELVLIMGFRNLTSGCCSMTELLQQFIRFLQYGFVVLVWIW